MDTRVTETLRLWGMMPHDRSTRQVQYLFPTWETLEQFCKRALPPALHEQYQSTETMTDGEETYSMEYIMHAIVNVLEATPEQLDHAALLVHRMRYASPGSIPNKPYQAAGLLESFCRLPVAYLDTVLPDPLGQYAQEHIEFIVYACEDYRGKNVPAEYLRALGIDQDPVYWKTQTGGADLYHAGIPAGYAASLRHWPVENVRAFYENNVPAVYAEGFRSPGQRIGKDRCAAIVSFHLAGVPVEYVTAAASTGVDGDTIIRGWQEAIPVEFLAASFGDQA